jgi:hypothetical protein
MKTSGKIILAIWGVAVCLIVALVIFTHSGTPPDNQSASTSSSSPDQSSAPHSSGTAAPAATVESASKAIVGKWRAVGFDENDDFRADGTLVITGQIPMTLKYSFPSATSIQFSPNGSAQVFVFKNVSITGDKLTMTGEKDSGPVTYERAP